MLLFLAGGAVVIVYRWSVRRVVGHWFESSSRGVSRPSASNHFDLLDEEEGRDALLILLLDEEEGRGNALLILLLDEEEIYKGDRRLRAIGEMETSSRW